MAAFYFELEPHRAAQQLPPAAARALKSHSAALLKAYSELSMTKEGLFYNVAPKMHYLTHLVAQSQFTNLCRHTAMGRRTWWAKWSRSAKLQPLAIPKPKSHLLSSPGTECFWHCGGEGIWG